MAAWLERVQPAKERFERLGLGARVGLIALGIVILGGIALYSAHDANAPTTVLFSNLAEDDAARIVERLRALNIPFSIGPDGTTVLVSEEKVHETRLMLAGEGLPNGGGVGFEVFDAQRFGESEFAEQVKYHRALEGELARTISHLSGVERARVHLVMPTRSLFSAADQSASASIVVHLKPGFRMREDQAKGIVHLVASSVRDLSAERVTLVDGDGKRLGGSGVGEGDQANDSDSVRRAIELSKERVVQQLLDTTLGVGKSVVRVAAEVSFTKEEWTEEHYDPDTIATRSFQISEEREGASGKTVGGVPGTPSNLPGGDAATTGAGGGGSGLARRNETRNYEISKTLRRGVEPVGRVTGVQVAVVVDGRWSGKEPKRKFTPLPKADLDRIQNITASALGLDSKRGDKVLVECVPFVTAAAPGPDNAVRGLDAILEANSKSIKYALMGVGVLFGIGLLVAGLRIVSRPGVLVPNTQEVTMASLGLGQKTEKFMPTGGGQHAQDRALPSGGVIKDDTMEQVRMLASELAAQEPEAAARVIRGWLGEGGT